MLVFSRNDKMMRIGKRPRSLQNRDLPRLGHRRETVRQLLDDGILVRGELSEIDLRICERHAVCPQAARRVDNESRMQQRLGRNAADIQANAAKHGPAVDKNHARAEIGRTKRRGIAPRPRTEHDDIAGMIRLPRAFCAHRILIPYRTS